MPNPTSAPTSDEPFALVAESASLTDSPEESAHSTKAVERTAAANDGWYMVKEGGYFCLPRNLVRHAARHLDGAIFRTYVLLASHQFAGHPTFPSSEALKKLAKTDASNVRKHIDALVQAGLVEWKPRGRGKEYTFRIPTEAQIESGYASFKLKQAKKKANKAQMTQPE